jgi:uncharacterized protein (TIGR02452 family)
MSRKQLAQMAHETLEIVNRGSYVAPGGVKVRLDDTLRYACEHSVLYKPEMFPGVFTRRDRLVVNAAKWATEFRVLNTTTLAVAREFAARVAGSGVLCLTTRVDRFARFDSCCHPLFSCVSSLSEFIW